MYASHTNPKLHIDLSDNAMSTMQNTAHIPHDVESQTRNSLTSLQAPLKSVKPKSSSTLISSQDDGKINDQRKTLQPWYGKGVDDLFDLVTGGADARDVKDVVIDHSCVCYMSLHKHSTTCSSKWLQRSFRRYEIAFQHYVTIYHQFITLLRPGHDNSLA